MRFFLLAIIVGICSMCAISSVALAQVVFSEVNWIGSDLSTADEWLELVNISDEEVNLFGWKITDSSSDMIIFSEDILIQPDEFFVISNYSEDNSRLSIFPNFISTAVSLLNNKLLLKLFNSSGSLIDQVDDGVGRPFAGGKTESGMYLSMERVDLLSAGDILDNWRDATESIGFDEDTPVRGTPGYENTKNQIPNSSSQSNSSAFSSSSDSLASSESSESSASSSSSDSSASSDSSESSASSYILPLPEVIISEILSNPKGFDDSEWIEIMYLGSGSISILGWELKVGSSSFILENEDLILTNSPILLTKEETNLSLRNKGDTVSIWSGSTLIFQIEYPETAEEISYGYLNGSYLPICFPTPGKPNTKIVQEVRIKKQSGTEIDYEKVTINVEAEALNGDIKNVDCRWYFTNGSYFEKCNPPSQTFENIGRHSIELRAGNMCGDMMVDVLNVNVLEKKSSSSSSSSSSFLSSSSSSSISSSSSSKIKYISEIIISEIYPSPYIGEEEWIELFNPTSHKIDLTGWKLDDIKNGGSKPWTIPQELGQIPPLSYVVFYKTDTHLTLNNSGDDVRIFSPDNSTGAIINYSKIKRGYSYVVDLDCISNFPTKGEKNICGNSSSSISNDNSSQQSSVKTQNFASQKNTPLPSFIKSKYKNVIIDYDKNNNGSGSLTWLMANFGGEIIHQPETQIPMVETQDFASVPYLELIFFILFLGLGWIFIFIGRRGNSQKISDNDEK